MGLSPRFGIFGAAACLLFIAGGGVFAQTPPPLTLEAAMAQAMSANPTIAAARLRHAVDLAGVGVARERPNPEFAYEAEKETPNQSFALTQPIELGGKRQRRIDLAQATMSVGDAELDRTIADIRSQVRRAYFDLASASRRVTIAEDLRTIAARTRDAARARFQAGDVSEFDAVRGESVLAAAEDDVTAARGDVEAARATLNALLGQPTTTPITTADDLRSAPMPALEDALAQANSKNAELAVFDKRITEQTARRDLARALQRPDLGAGGALTYNSLPEFTYGWRLSFTVTLPVFTQRRAGVEVEDRALAQLKAERAARAAEIGGEVAAALAHAAAAREQMTRYDTVNLPLAQQQERMAQDSYNAGQTRLEALLEALQSAREIRRRGVQAALDYQAALADLERAIGAIR